MCGIGAILRTDGGWIPETWLDAIDRRIAYRGPDGAGRFRDEAPATDGAPAAAVALVHRRLSIIDPEDGAQPMVAGAGADALAVVFNGCIYNHRDLRRDLEQDGATFRTDHSDTEVLLHGFRAWGPSLADRLEGMYAWVLWDRRMRTLHAARDWFGEKPLFEARLRASNGEDGDIRVLASDARAVADVVARICAETDATVDGDDTDTAEWLRQYLRFGYDLRETPWPGVRNVPIALPEPLRAPGGQAGPTADAGNVEQRLEQAVARRLEADVPLGCFLSGGVDSSLIALFARRHLRDLRTFSVRMPDARYDESKHAERVARHLKTDHTTLEVEPDPAGDLVHLVETLGRPLADSSLLPTYWVSRAAREHVTVALSGDGGDELFYGYERYAAARLLRRGAGPLGLLPPGLGAGGHPKSRLHKLGRLGAMARASRRFGVLATELLFAPDVLGELAADGPAPDIATSPDGAADLRAADLTRYLPGDLLAKVDTASMAVALEVRCPFLDRELAGLVIPAPRSRLMRGGRKGLLRTIARAHLPNAVVDRPKMGFAIPVGEWFRDDFGSMRTLLLDQLAAADPFGPLPVNREPVDRMLREHGDATFDHGQRLFALLSLSLWASRFA